jgi:hypothetical protein
MAKPVKIKYERRPGRGAAAFMGLVYMDDGTTILVSDYRPVTDLKGLPVEHEMNGIGKPSPPAVTFPPRHAR